MQADCVCAVCDDGGWLTCCEGVCLRSFHLGKKDPKCRLALGVTKQQAKMMSHQMENFICKNCRYQQHQCFACGLLGSSDMASQATDGHLFQCEREDCGHFYHAKCVAELLHPDSEQAILFAQQVMDRVGFSCPVHECIVCREGENPDDFNMQFAVCRRCPTSYHRKCLPRVILSEQGSLMQRAWDGIHPNRILIFCMKHEIVRNLGTPKRDHIIMPPDVLEGDELLDHPTLELSMEEDI